MHDEELERLRDDLARANRDCVSALRLVACIREAVGDPEGRLMQSDLLAHCRKLAAFPSATAKAEEVLELAACGFKSDALKDMAKSALAALREVQP